MIENDLLDNHQYICACDEVGRGPLAGPVVSCAVYTSSAFLSQKLNFLRSLGVNDSKALTAVKREKLIKQLKVELKFDQRLCLQTPKGEIYYAITKQTPKKIDEINILKASLMSMRNSSLKASRVSKLGQERVLLLIDGNKTFSVKDSWEGYGVIKGDSRSCLIGLASIIAKEKRDHLMKKMSKKYPEYGFEKNSGYPTKIHLEAIKKFGITPIHRKSFKGVKEYL